MLLLVAAVVGILILGKQVPGGFIPDEDKGYFFISGELPDAASLQRSKAVSKQVEAILNKTEGISSFLNISGFSIMSGVSSSNSFTFFVSLKDWNERTTRQTHVKGILRKLMVQFAQMPEARILAELPEGTADECAEKLLPFVKNLLITGGHGDETEIHNRLYSRDGLRETFYCQRLPGSYHGSGCTLASALAGRLAQGENLASAVRTALDYTWRTLRDAEQLGKGQFVPRRLPLDFCS